MEPEIKHALYLGNLKLEKLLKDYNNADGLVLFNNKSGERALYSISNPKAKSVFESTHVYSMKRINSIRGSLRRNSLIKQKMVSQLISQRVERG